MKRLKRAAYCVGVTFNCLFMVKDYPNRGWELLVDLSLATFFLWLLTDRSAA